MGALTTYVNNKQQHNAATYKSLQRLKYWEHKAKLETLVFVLTTVNTKWNDH